MSNEPLRVRIENLFLQCRDFGLFRKCLDNVLKSKGLDHNIDRERAEKAEDKLQRIDDILAQLEDIERGYAADQIHEARMIIGETSE